MSAQGASGQERRLRVAIVAPPLQAHFGGQEVQAHDLVASWPSDPTVKAQLVSNRPVFPGFLTYVDQLPYLRTFARFPWYLYSLYRATREVDILHVFAASYRSFGLATMPAVAVGRLLRKRVLIHYHSGRAHDHLRRSAAARYVLRSVDLVVVPSVFLSAAFEACQIQPTVVPNLIDPARFPYRARDPLRPSLLCTRNFEPHYGVDIVLNAFSLIQKEFPHATLILVGRGTAERQLRKLVETLGLNNVAFKGAVPPAMMPELYAQSDIFINGSHADCSPVSILESFCSGLPVVTTAAGGIPHLVTHDKTGLVSPLADPEALAANVVRLLQQPHLARVLAGHARQVAEGHSWQNLRVAWLEAYSSLIRS